MKNTNKQPVRKRGFSDRLYVYNMSFVTIVVTLSFVLMFISIDKSFIDLSPLAYIVPSAFGELGIHTGLIIWKAKNENERKFNYGNKNATGSVPQENSTFGDSRYEEN